MAEERTMRNQASKRLSSDMENQDSREQNKRGKGPLNPPDSSLWVCNNPACRATQSTVPRFCKSCSCCICYRFDNYMDPSLWLKCTPDSGSEGSCGFSCHVECALRHGKVGQLKVQLDGCYSCAYCSKVSSIIGCWKEQLKIASDSNRVDALCYRISLSYRLLNGTSKFRELHKFIEDLKANLEMEVGPINLTTGKMFRPYVCRLHAASRLQAMCKLAMRKAEELLSSNSTSVSNLNVAEGSVLCSVPQHRSSADESRLKSIRVTQGSCSRAGEVQHETLQSLPDLNEEYREADLKPNTAPPTTSNGSGGLDDSFENIVKTICELEHNSFVTEQFRMKFLTWFSMKAMEHERRIVRTFVQTMIDDSRRLAEQLIDTFSGIIFSSKP